jgi:hypothetical protein
MELLGLILRLALATNWRARPRLNNKAGLAAVVEKLTKLAFFDPN